MLRRFVHPVACCCVLLEGLAQSLKPVKLQATCKRTQHCWELLANNVASVCTGLNAAELIGRGRGGGGEFSSSHRGHVSMWSLDMYYPAPRGPFLKYLR